MKEKRHKGGVKKKSVSIVRRIRRRGECVGSEMEERERWRRERRHEEETTQQGWTVAHSLNAILVTFPTSHAERSPLNLCASLNTDDGEGGHRERRRRRRRRRRGECVGSEMEERERDGDGRGDMRKRQHSRDGQ